MKRRRIGLEIEYPVVDCTGNAFPVQSVFQPIIEKGWIPHYDDIYTDKIIAVSNGDKLITVDAGEGILEINEPPFDSLWEAKNSLESTLSFVGEELAFLGGRMLGFGTQPFERKSNWTKKGRYDLLRNILPPSVGKITRTAASQVHIDVGKGEIFKVVNALNALSGVAIALCANSSVMYGENNGRKAKREAIWEEFAPKRSGIPPWFRTNRELFSYLESLPFLVAKTGGNYSSPKVSFRDFECLEEERLDYYLCHEGSIWFSARPRLKYGTVEFRPCCTQPHNESMVPATFVLGVVESLEEIYPFLEKLHFQEYSFRDFRKNAIEKGLIEKTFIRDILFAVYNGLKKRKKGEEILMKPFYKRMKDGCPAEKAMGLDPASFIKKFAL